VVDGIDWLGGKLGVELSVDGEMMRWNSSKSRTYSMLYTDVNTRDLFVRK
jgi:hypothetical protein